MTYRRFNTRAVRNVTISQAASQLVTRHPFFVNFSTHQLIMRNRNSLGSRLSRIIVAILQNKSSRLAAELSTLVFAETP